MKIGELAKYLKINTSTIRYYEKQGLLPEPERTSSGYRVYNETDIKALNIIKLAQSLGFNLNEIRQIFAANAELNHQEVLSKLENKKVEMASLIGELQNKQAQIDLLITDLNETWGEGRCLEVNSDLRF